MAEKKRDLFLRMTEEELLDQVVENPSDAAAHAQAVFLLNYKMAKRQVAFNFVVTIATLAMAIQAVAELVRLVLLASK